MNANPDSLVIKQAFAKLDREQIGLFQLACSMVLGFLWLIAVINDFSPFNYFFLSAFVGIQLYFWAARYDEILTLTPTHYTYQFMFYKKTRRISSYHKLEVYHPDNPMVRYSKTEATDCLLLQNDQFERKILRINWSEFDAIESFVSQHYPANTQIKKPFRIHFMNLNTQFILFYLLTVSLILCLGVLSELPQTKKQLTEFPYIDGSIINYEIKTSSRYGDEIKIGLREYPGKKFILNNQKINLIRKNNHPYRYEFNHIISLHIARDDYEQKILKTQPSPYFTSHLLNQNKIKIYGIIYNYDYVLEPKQFIGMKKTDWAAGGFSFIGLITILAHIYIWNIKYKDPR